MRSPNWIRRSRKWRRKEIEAKKRCNKRRSTKWRKNENIVIIIGVLRHCHAIYIEHVIKELSIYYKNQIRLFTSMLLFFFFSKCISLPLKKKESSNCNTKKRHNWIWVMLVAAIVKTKSRFDGFHLPPHGARSDREREREIGWSGWE